MALRTVFFDFDYTLSNKAVLDRLYAERLATVLSSQFGGDIPAWCKAAYETVKELEAEYTARFTHNPLAGYNEWFSTVQIKAGVLLFEKMQIPLPPDIAKYGQETQFNTLSQCQALFPGVRQVLATLHSQGYQLHTASANDSEFLRAALTGGAIESFIQNRYGPDLVDCAKEGIAFYERLFAFTGVSPSETVVVDDDPEALIWAMQLGAKAIQTRLVPDHLRLDAPGVLAVLTNFADLPELLLGGV